MAAAAGHPLRLLRHRRARLVPGSQVSSGWRLLPPDRSGARTRQAVKEEGCGDSAADWAICTSAIPHVSPAAAAASLSMRARAARPTRIPAPTRCPPAACQPFLHPFPPLPAPGPALPLPLPLPPQCGVQLLRPGAVRRLQPVLHHADTRGRAGRCVRACVVCHIARLLRPPTTAPPHQVHTHTRLLQWQRPVIISDSLLWHRAHSASLKHI